MAYQPDRTEGYRASDRPLHTASGHFRKGNKAGGRKPKLKNFDTIIRKKAAEHGLDIDEMLWGAARGMFLAAANGDVNAAKLLFDRFFGPVEVAPQVNVDVQSNMAIVGPPVPQRRALAEQLEDIHTVAARVLTDEEARDAELGDLLG